MLLYGLHQKMFAKLPAFFTTIARKTDIVGQK